VLCHFVVTEVRQVFKRIDFGEMPKATQATAQQTITKTITVVVNNDSNNTNIKAKTTHNNKFVRSQPTRMSWPTTTPAFQPRPTRARSTKPEHGVVIVLVVVFVVVNMLKIYMFICVHVDLFNVLILHVGIFYMMFFIFMLTCLLVGIVHVDTLHVFFHVGISLLLQWLRVHRQAHICCVCFLVCLGLLSSSQR
jgi:hypothetical protein